MKPILGTMTFGEQVDQETSRAMLDLFASHGGIEIDTANGYTEGRSETILGALLSDERPYTASKVNPWNDQGLQPQQIRKQLEQSLQRLGTSQIDLLYLHAPDPETPITDTLECCFEMFQEGKFKEFGLSNYAAWQVAEIVELCRQHGWM